MIKQLTQIAGALSILAALAGVGHTQMTTVNGNDISITDGDTIRLGDEKIRLIGPDAPESWHPRCDHELDVAMQATDAIRAKIEGHAITIERHGTDKYHRTLANVYNEQGDIGEQLIRENLAVRWTPGRASWLERAHHWCPDYNE